MMCGYGKSDDAIVAGKPTNKAMAKRTFRGARRKSCFLISGAMITAYAALSARRCSACTIRET